MRTRSSLLSLPVVVAAIIVAATIAATTITGCRADRPERSGEETTPAPQAGSSATPGGPADTIAFADSTTPGTTTLPDGATATPDSAGPSPSQSQAAHEGAITGGAGTASNRRSAGPGWKRSELVSGVQEFVAAIDSNNQERFWGSLSQRSIRMIDRDRLAPREEIWKAARETLSDIENRHVTVVGGSRDSVALQIDGLRMIDGSREDDPVVIHLLREQGSWKVMYPGLGYPKGHLRR